MKDYSENAIKIYERLYLARDNNDNITETVEDCHIRVAGFLSHNKEEYDNFKRLLDEQKFRPNTPCMANAGIKSDPMMLACHVLGIRDSMDSIIEMWGTCAKVYEGGGGTGLPITNLRRKGSPLSSGGFASGPLSYLDVVESISNSVKSGGKNRRAANLAAAYYQHPDILNIINCKKDKKSYQSINLSVSVDDFFMELIEKELFNQEIALTDPKEGPMSYTTVGEIWNNIVDAAWNTGDPGLLFLDRMNEDNPLENRYGRIVCTNPCGEVGLWNWSSCCLGHMNLNKYYSNAAEFNFINFKTDIYWATLFLNRIIEKTSYPNPRFKEMMHTTRPIGLGLMGFADILYKAGIRYGSNASASILSNITGHLTKYAFSASSTLVQNNIIPALELNTEEKQKFTDYLNKFGFKSRNFKSLPGNITVTCIAPTGSTAISADCSYSFEPHFALTWTKEIADGKNMVFTNPIFEKELDKLNIDSEEKDFILRKIKEHNGSIQSDGFKLPIKIKEIFVVAHDIPTEKRIKMQAAAQKNITMSVSSTVNLPNSATKKDVADVYLQAWRNGLKGITVYRNGCLDSQPVNFGSKEQKKENEGQVSQNDLQAHTSQSEQKKMVFGKNYKRPMLRNSLTFETKTPLGQLYVTGSFDHGKIMEVFINVGEQGNRENAFINGLGRVISRSLQRGVDLSDLTDTLRGSGGDVFWMNIGEDRPIQVKGILDAIATILDQKFNGEFIQGYISELVKDEEYEEDEIPVKLDRCPSCLKFTLNKTIGCRSGMCINPECGYSNCS